MTPAYDYSHRRLLEIAPEIWPLVYTRHYNSPPGYASNQLPATIFGVGLCYAKHPEILGGKDMTSGNVMLAAALSQQYDFPTYYVSREMALAVLATDPPAGTWDDVPFPFPSITFMLPDGILSDRELGTIRCLTVSRADVGRYVFRGLGIPGGMNVRDYARIVITTGFPCAPRQEMMIEGSVFPTTEPLRVSEDFFSRPMMLPDGYVEGEFSKDPSFASDCTALASRLLLAMDAEPGLIERGPRTGKRLGKGGVDIWQPNWIGRTYRIPRAGTASPDGGGWHVRLHWRRGHFRLQRVGVDLQGTKRIWIKPMLIGAHAEAAVGQ